MNISGKVSILLTFLLNLPTYERQGIHICPTLGGVLEAIPSQGGQSVKYFCPHAKEKQVSPEDLKHSSMGSLGNLCTEQIKAKMDGAARF